MEDIQHAVRKAEANLNRALAEYERTSELLELEFREIKLQACIFQFDICVEMAGIIQNRPTGFAASVALKDLVLRLYEYDQLLNKHLIARLLALAKARNILIDREFIRAQRRQWRSELSRPQQWSDVRNKAVGHYEKNLSLQVQLLKTLSVSEVFEVTQAFLQFNMGVLQLVRDAGRGNDA
jgi:hypothetical protein